MHGDTINGVLELFKVVVVEESQKTGEIDESLLSRGVVVDCSIDRKTKNILERAYQPLRVRTMFGVEERDNASFEQLIYKQVLHYVEVYGLDSPGLFDLEVDGGEKYAMTYVKGVTATEVSNMLRALLASNAPVKYAELVCRLVKEFDVGFDVNNVANNELRIMLFDQNKNIFTNGDDAVRWMVYWATGNALLIKSPEVIEAVRSKGYSKRFFDDHAMVLGNVFNRHKRIILAAKDQATRTAINKITRQSKKYHIPIKEPISKRYVSGALTGEISPASLKHVSVRDKMKYLNLLSHKKQQSTIDAFVIRNGKIHIAEGRTVWSKKDIDRVEMDVLKSLFDDLVVLKGKKILLDPNVHYGLPISRKQAVGQLPFGTRVKVDLGDRGQLSSGIYWKNSGGATDLDLSTIDLDGNRTGWGQGSGYDRQNPITYSGDVTSAPSGAMEFMTSRKSSYALYVNIYSGMIGCEAEVVVGMKTKSEWIDKFAIREKITLTSRGSLIGFVHEDSFVVFQGKMGNGNVSGSKKEKAMVSRGASEFWTINSLFNALDIKFDVDRNPENVYHYDLTYNGFSYDKLEEVLLG